MFHTDVGNSVQQCLRLLGVFVDPSLAVLEQLRATTLNHVAEQSPWSATETNQRNSASQLLSRQSNSLVHVTQFLSDVNRAVHHLAVLLVLWGAQRVGEVRSLALEHLNYHAHGLGDDEDIGEDNGSVDETSKAIDWLEGQGRGNLGIAAAFEKVTAIFDFVVFGEITTSCKACKRAYNL